MLYLRRKNLEESLKKLKRGESIGPVTKAALEGKEEEKKEDEPSTEPKTVDKVGKEEAIQEVEDEIKGSSECTETSSQDEPAKPVAVVPDVETSDTPLIKIENEDTSDTHSVSDFPPTPPSTDLSTITPEPEAQSSDLVDENVRDHLELREATSTLEIPNRSVLSNPENLNDLTSLSANSSKPDASDTSVVEPAKPTTPEEKTETKEDEEKTEVVRVITPSGTKQMEGWQMLEMVLNWVKNEFSADEKALARQLANNEISFRFLWLYYIPGNLISVEDPVSKQQMAARVLSLIYSVWLPVPLSSSSYFASFSTHLDCIDGRLIARSICFRLLISLIGSKSTQKPSMQMG